MDETFRTPPSMMPLSPMMYRFACHMAHLAERDPYAPVMAVPLAAVIHASTSLEAFLNEEIARRIAIDPEWEGSLSALDRLEIGQKWMVVPKLPFGRTFVCGAEPFQSFRVLVKLRNKLVHYKPRFTSEENMPSFARELEARFQFTKQVAPAPLENFLTSWQEKILNRNCARWACTTAREMVLAWHDLSGQGQGRAVADWEWSLAFLEGKDRGELPPGVYSIRVDPGVPAVVNLTGLSRPSGLSRADDTTDEVE